MNTVERTCRQKCDCRSGNDQIDARRLKTFAYVKLLSLHASFMLLSFLSSGHLGDCLYRFCAAGTGLRPPGGRHIRHIDSHIQDAEVMIRICVFP